MTTVRPNLIGIALVFSAASADARIKAKRLLPLAIKTYRQCHTLAVLLNAASVREERGHGYSDDLFDQSVFGVEGDLPGIESYTRRQLVWISHA
jgi:hypothetical protein